MNTSAWMLLFYIYLGSFIEEGFSQSDEDCSFGAKAFNASYWIGRYKMIKTPFGAFGKLKYENKDVQTDNLPAKFPPGSRRSYFHHFQFVLKGTDINYFGKTLSDIVLHWYSGYPLKVYTFHPTTKKFEFELLNMRNPIILIPAGVYFAEEIKDKKPEKFCLFGCSLGPAILTSEVELMTQSDVPKSVKPAIISEISRLIKPQEDV